MDIKHFSFSERGPRDSNQDRLLEPYVRPEGCCLAAIADGIGGSNGGDLAADLAVNTVRLFRGTHDKLESVFKSSVEQMKEKSNSDPFFAKMGTTLSIAYLSEKIVYTAHVGDTRIYHLRAAGLKTLTQDQTEVAELRRKGVLTDSQARRYPRKNVLLSALSPAGDYEVQLNSSTLEIGDRLLLLTDGVYQRLQRGAIIKQSLANDTIEGLVRGIENQVLAKEPSDNYSVIGIEIQNW